MARRHTRRAPPPPLRSSSRAKKVRRERLAPSSAVCAAAHYDLVVRRVMVIRCHRDRRGATPALIRAMALVGMLVLVLLVLLLCLVAVAGAVVVSAACFSEPCFARVRFGLSYALWRCRRRRRGHKAPHGPPQNACVHVHADAEPLLLQSGVALARLLRTRQVTSAALVELAIRQLERVNRE